MALGTVLSVVLVLTQEYKVVPLGQNDWENVAIGKYGGYLVIGSLDNPKTFNHHIA